MENVKVIAAVEEGSVISPFYDNLVAQVIAHGSTRQETIATLVEFLGRVRIEGVGTNVPLLRKILEDDEFLEGRHDTAYVARLLERIDVEDLVGLCQCLPGARHNLRGHGQSPVGNRPTFVPRASYYKKARKGHATKSLLHRR